MLISDLSIKRPVGAIVLSLAIILLGVVGFEFLGVRLYPAIDPPVINVRTSYTGANSEIIESQITEPLEKSINGVEGVKSITSQSSVGTSSITVEFELGSDLEKAANDVRDKVSQATRTLPQDLDATPTVTKADADNEPIIMLACRSLNMNQLELSDYAENILMEKLQTISGVSSVTIWGQMRPSMRMWLDPKKMVAYGVTASDVKAALDAENVEVPGGTLRGNSTELIVKTTGRLYSEEDFNNMTIARIGENLIKLSDIGEAEIASQREAAGSKINGTPNVTLAIMALPGANNIEIADEFYERLKQIKTNLPNGMDLIVTRDRSVYVRRSVEDVVETLAIAILLVVMIIFVFFRNWKIALRPLLDIPVSLIGTFFVMYIFGFSINVLTLLGIVLATGLVVDDGIVVTENIFKRIEKGMPIMKAAIEGTREIFFAVVSTSLTLAIVFVPVIFLEGFTGRLFREFGVVVASSILISALVSLTLTPVLNIKLTGKNDKHSNFYIATEKYFIALENAYRRGLDYFMNRKWLSVAMIALCLLMIYGIGTTIQSELAPLEDQGYIHSPVTAPEGTDFAETQKIVDSVAQIIYDKFPEADYVMARYGSGPSASGNGGFISTMLTPAETRDRTQMEIAGIMMGMFASIPDARIFATQEPTISTSMSRGLPVQFVLQNLDFKKIREVTPKFLEAASSNPVFRIVDVNLKFNKPEVNIEIDRLKANTLGVSEKDIAETISLAFSGTRYGYFLRNNKQYYIIGQVAKADRSKPTDVSSMYVRASNGTMIQLDNLIKMSEKSNPPVLYHYNRYKSATFSADLADGYSLSDGITAMKQIADSLLDETFDTALAGQSRDFSESSSNTLFALLLALVLVYLILAAQFESFIDPFIIMITVPLAIAGALLSLEICGETLNIFSEIGIIMLIGIVTKNGILIVEFANQKRETGLPKAKAAFEAACARLRPILMTSLATIFGTLPIALALGAAAGSRTGLGVAVVGGLLFSLLLTLFVIPSLYAVMSRSNQHNKIEASEGE